VIGEERAAKETAEEGLEANPFHQAVEILILCMKRYVDQALPVCSGLIQRMGNFVGSIVFLKNFLNIFPVFFHAQKDNIVRFFIRGESNFGESESAHGFFACICMAAGVSVGLFIYGAGMGVAAPFSDKVFYGGIETFRGISFTAAAHYIVDLPVPPVPFFIKRHGGAYQDAVFGGPYPMEERRYMTVVSYIVRAPAVDGDSRPGCHGLRRIGNVLNHNMHDFHGIIFRNKRSYGGTEPENLRGAL
jgi:hypothetical protein